MIQLSSETIWALRFHFGEFLIKNSISFMVIGLFRLSISSYLNFSSLWFLRNCSIFFLSCHIYKHTVVCSTPLFFFNGCTMWNDISDFIPDIGVLCSIFVSLARGLPNSLFFWRTNFLFPWGFVFSNFFLFPILFSVLSHSCYLLWVYFAPFSSFWRKEVIDMTPFLILNVSI